MQLWYGYAKTLGEREAWRLAEELGVDLVVVNPSFVVGPLLAPQPTSSLRLTLDIVKGLRATSASLGIYLLLCLFSFFLRITSSMWCAGELNSYPNFTVGFVHIDDVVSSHILAMEDAAASGRLVCSSEVAHWSEIVEMLRSKYPSYPVVTKLVSLLSKSHPSRWVHLFFSFHFFSLLFLPRSSRS